MLWITLLALPAALAVYKLGAALTMLSVVSLALQAASVMIFILVFALAVMLYRQR